MVAVVVFFILGPLPVFVAPLAAAKRAALRDYGHLARRYVDEFDDKWLLGWAPKDEPLVGSADIQSLADLGNSLRWCATCAPSRSRGTWWSSSSP